MSIRKATAIFQNTFKNMMRNKRALVMFLMFPIMTVVFYYMIPEQKEFFRTIFLPMHLIVIPAAMIAGIISEEREKNTLKQLIMANVKPLEYFLGVGLFVLIVSLLSASLFLVVMSLSAAELLRFYIIVALTTLCSMVIGAVFGIISKDQMSTNSLVMPFSIILGVLPMFSAFNDTIKNITSIIYTQTLSNVVTSINETISIKDYGVMAANFAVCLIIFVMVYRNRKLDG